MNYQGIIIGMAAFLIIGVFHPIVIKTEYHFGKRVWPVFLAAGLVLILYNLSLQADIYPPKYYNK